MYLMQEFYTDGHAIGTSYSDVIITDSADVIISGGDVLRYLNASATNTLPSVGT